FQRFKPDRQPPKYLPADIVHFEGQLELRNHLICEPKANLAGETYVGGSVLVLGAGLKSNGDIREVCSPVDISVDRAAVSRAKTEQVGNDIDLNAGVSSHTPRASGQLHGALTVYEVDPSPELHRGSDHLNARAYSHAVGDSVGHFRVDVIGLQIGLDGQESTFPIGVPGNHQAVRCKQSQSHAELVGDSVRRVDMGWRNRAHDAVGFASGEVTCERK